MTANVVAKTAAIVDDLRYLAAIELLIAAQAVDLAGVDRGDDRARRTRGCTTPCAPASRCSTAIARSARTSRRSSARCCAGRFEIDGDRR